jgi:hypothetical protein
MVYLAKIHAFALESKCEGAKGNIKDINKNYLITSLLLTERGPHGKKTIVLSSKIIEKWLQSVFR